METYSQTSLVISSIYMEKLACRSQEIGILWLLMLDLSCEPHWMSLISVETPGYLWTSLDILVTLTGSSGTSADTKSTSAKLTWTLWNLLYIFCISWASRLSWAPVDVSEPHLLLIDQVVKTWPPPMDKHTLLILWIDYTSTLVIWNVWTRIEDSQ